MNTSYKEEGFCLERLNEDPSVLENLVHIERIKNVGFSLESYHALEAVYPNIFDGINVKRVTSVPSASCQKEAMIAIEASGLMETLGKAAGAVAGIGLIGMVIKWIIGKVRGDSGGSGGGSDEKKERSESDYNKKVSNVDSAIKKKAEKTEERRVKKNSQLDQAITEATEEIEKIIKKHSNSKKSEDTVPWGEIEKMFVKPSYGDNLSGGMKDLFTAFMRAGRSSEEAEVLTRTVIAGNLNILGNDSAYRTMAREVTELRGMDHLPLMFGMCTTGVRGIAMLPARVADPKSNSWVPVTKALNEYMQAINKLLTVSNAATFSLEMAKCVSKGAAAKAMVGPLKDVAKELASLRDDTNKKYGFSGVREGLTPPKKGWSKMTPKRTATFLTSANQVIIHLDKNFIKEAETFVERSAKSPLAKYLEMAPGDKHKFNLLASDFRNHVTTMGSIAAAYRRCVEEHFRLAEMAEKRITA